MTTNESPPISAEQLAALPPEFRGLLQSIIDHYERRCDELRREVAELKAELQSMRKTPLNSSVPPSTEHPHAKSAGVAGATETPDSKKQKKKRGGQQGHPKRERELVPVEQCDAVVSLRPTECRGCGERLCGDDPDPVRHQVWELPQP